MSNKEYMELFKSLDIPTKGLKPYSKLYGTVSTTFGYEGSSMWSYSICERTGMIDYHTTYIKATDKHVAYNKLKQQQYWMGRYNEIKHTLKDMDEPTRLAWEEIKNIHQS
jgi:hypothetical protein